MPSAKTPSPKPPKPAPFTPQGKPHPTASSPEALPGMPAPIPSVEFRQPSRAVFTPFGLFGGALLMLCVAGLVLNFTLPWVQEGDATRNREDLETEFGAGDAFQYSEDLIGLPVPAYILGIVAGFGLLLLDVVPGLWMGIKRLVQATFLLTAAFFAFVLTLTGFRWLGSYFADLMSEGDSGHLHVVPYINIVLGLAILLGSLWMLRRAVVSLVPEADRPLLESPSVRISAWTALVVAGALLAMPLLPYATIDLGGDQQVSEGLLVLAETGALGIPDELQTAGEHYAMILTMLWIALYLAIGTTIVALLAATKTVMELWGFLTQLYALNVVTLIIGIVYTILLYVTLPKIVPDATTLAFNWFPALAMLALAGLYALYVLRVLVPFAASMKGRMGAAYAAE